MKGQYSIWSWRTLFTLLPLIFMGYFLFQVFSTATVYQVPDAMKQFQIDQTSIVSQLLTLLGIPKEFQWFPAILYLLVIPYMAVALITYGFLSEINIFTNSPGINGWLAFIIGFSLIPYGTIVKATTAMLAAIGAYGTLAFGGLAFFGIGWVVLQRMQGWGWSTSGTYQGIANEERYNELANWLNQVAGRNAGNAQAPQVINDIPQQLRDADNQWRKGNATNAVRILERFARRIAAAGRRGGLNLPPRPRDIRG